MIKFIVKKAKYKIKIFFNILETAALCATSSFAASKASLIEMTNPVQQLKECCCCKTKRTNERKIVRIYIL